MKTGYKQNEFSLDLIMTVAKITKLASKIRKVISVWLFSLTLINKFTQTAQLI